MLEDRILNLLSTENVAVIVTVAPDGSPAATPVRYYSLGFETMYTSWNDSPSPGTCVATRASRPASSRRSWGRPASAERSCSAQPGHSNATIRGRSLLGGLPLAVRSRRTRPQPGPAATRPVDRHHSPSHHLHRPLAATRWLPPPADLDSLITDDQSGCSGWRRPLAGAGSEVPAQRAPDA
jgi:hypothetical protein